MKKVILAIGGASGSIYARMLLDKLEKLSSQLDKVSVVMSENASVNWEIEQPERDFKSYPFDFFDNKDFMAPFASGSAKYDAMIIAPCSMGLLGRIASGSSNDLISRASDVMLKERRKLILVIRECPYNLIHIENMRTITLAGGIICPASPSFYSKPENIEALVGTVVDRVLDLAGFDHKSFRWQENK